MTTLKVIERQYPTLAPDERFRLAVAAVVRDDRGDLARLVDTCPRETWSLTQAAYRERIEALARVLNLAAVTIADLVRGVMVAEALAVSADALWSGIASGYALGYAHGWRACWAWHGAGGDTPEHADQLRYTLDQLEPEGEAEAEAQAAALAGQVFKPARAAAFLVAFEEWAADATGASAGELVAAFRGEYLAGRLNTLRAAAAGVDPDPEALADWRGGLAELWAVVAPKSVPGSSVVKS